MKEVVVCILYVDHAAHNQKEWTPDLAGEVVTEVHREIIQIGCLAGRNGFSVQCKLWLQSAVLVPLGP